jgi:hypothetical protein
MLFLQGEADFQVTLPDLDGWRTALSSHKNVAFKSHPKLNHLFLPSTVDDEHDYATPGTVDPKVIDDIAEFVR